MRVTHKLECPIDAAEISNAKDAHARLTLEYERLENEAKERAAKDRKELKSMWDEIVELASKSQRGVAMREVKCEERIDLDRGKKIVVRLDTGKEVEELEEDYDVEKEEPITAHARKKGGKGAKASPTPAAEKQPELPGTATKFNVGADGLVAVLDVTGKERRVLPVKAEAILVANEKGTVVYASFDDDPNVELAMVVGTPVFGLNAEGSQYPLSAKQIRIFREALKAKTSFAIPVGDESVEIVGIKGGPSLLAPKKSSKKVAATPKKGAKASAAKKDAKRGASREVH